MFLLVNYIKWHYSYGLRGILSVQRNYVQGSWHKFLIRQHLRTLFSPWHRVTVSQLGKPVGIADRIFNVVIELYFRLVAGLIRMTIIIIGLFWSAFNYILFLFIYIFWLFWPVIFLIFLFEGIRHLFN